MLRLTQRHIFIGLVVFILGISFGTGVVSPVRLVNSQNTVDSETELLRVTAIDLHVVLHIIFRRVVAIAVYKT